MIKCDVLLCLRFRACYYFVRFIEYYEASVCRRIGVGRLVLLTVVIVFKNGEQLGRCHGPCKLNNVYFKVFMYPFEDSKRAISKSC